MKNENDMEVIGSERVPQETSANSWYYAWRRCRLDIHNLREHVRHIESVFKDQLKQPKSVPPLSESEQEMAREMREIPGFKAAFSSRRKVNVDVRARDRAIYLALQAGFSMAQIARVIECPVSTVMRQAKREILRRQKAKLND